MIRRTWRRLFQLQRHLIVDRVDQTGEWLSLPSGGASRGYRVREAHYVWRPHRLVRLHHWLTAPSRLPTGTKTLLFGVHQVFLHPVIVAAAWWRLYGVPRDPRLWVAFVVHDWGYWGKPCLDCPEGETHPLVGARIMDRLAGTEWYMLVLGHSRFMAKRHRLPYSRLCVADKLAVAMYPPWLYLTLARLTGELNEYMDTYRTRAETGQDRIPRSAWYPIEARDWFRNVTTYLRAWANEHRDLRPDTWTNRDAAPDADAMNGVRP